MNEINFRAWDKKNEVMHSYDIDNDATFVILPDGDVCQAGTSVEGGTGEHVWAVCEESNENFILMQFTGLKDKNGKKIYKGDYLLVNGVHRLEVIFAYGAFKYFETAPMFSTKFGDGWLHELATMGSDTLKNVEVCGNIYEEATK